jgi:ABC-2 type transport system permease protein
LGLVAVLFSLLGFTNGILARTFDDISLVPTFLLGPLIYLGGVFYSVTMLPAGWVKVAQLNPMFHIINAIREAMLHQQDVNMVLSIGFIMVLIAAATVLNLILLKRGTGLRS